VPLTDVSFTVDKPDLAKTRRLIEALKADVGFQDLTTDENIAKLSLVGVGMRTHSGVAAKMFETLAADGINIGMISTSEIKIAVLIELSKGEQAARAVHRAFLG
jgi:aspartate kinase